MCEDGKVLEPEEFGLVGSCYSAAGHGELAYCPNTCDEIYNSDKTNVDPTCLNGAIVT